MEVFLPVVVVVVSARMGLGERPVPAGAELAALAALETLRTRTPAAVVVVPAVQQHQRVALVAQAESSFAI